MHLISQAAEAGQITHGIVVKANAAVLKFLAGEKLGGRSVLPRRFRGPLKAGWYAFVIGQRDEDEIVGDDGDDAGDVKMSIPVAVLLGEAIQVGKFYHHNML